jgi:hypothetical protein
MPTLIRDDSTSDRAVYINPALIAILDRRIATTSIEALQADVTSRVRELLDHRVRTFHIDVNFPDYAGFGLRAPFMNASVFTPAFVTALSAFARTRGALVDLHLLTGQPTARVRAPAGGGVFQLDAAATRKNWPTNRANPRLGACAKPRRQERSAAILRPHPGRRRACAPSCEISMLTLRPRPLHRALTTRAACQLPSRATSCG